MSELPVYKIPCGRVMGHGEYCCEGYMCGGCEEINRLRREVAVLLDNNMQGKAFGWRACIDHIIKPEDPCPVCKLNTLSNLLDDALKRMRGG